MKQISYISYVILAIRASGGPSSLRRRLTQTRSHNLPQRPLILGGWAQNVRWKSAIVHPGESGAIWKLSGAFDKELLV